MKIACDIDGVLYSWDKTARFLLNHYFGYELSESQSWDYIEQKVSKEAWKWLWSEGVKLGLFRHGHLYRGAIEGVKRLAEYGEIVIITSRPKSAGQDTLDWLSYHKFPVTEVHIMPGQPKSSVRCDAYIDDSLDNAYELAQNTPADVYLWNRPWNQDLTFDDGLPGTYRVNNWKDIFRIMEYKKEVVPV